MGPAFVISSVPKPGLLMFAFIAALPLMEFGRSRNGRPLLFGVSDYCNHYGPRPLSQPVHFLNRSTTLGLLAALQNYLIRVI